MRNYLRKINDDWNWTPNFTERQYKIASGILIFAYLCVSFFCASNRPVWDDYEVIFQFLNNLAKTSSWKEQFFQFLELHYEHRVVLVRVIAFTLWKLFGHVDLQLYQWIGDFGWLAFAALLLSQAKDWSIRFLLCTILFGFRSFDLFVFPMGSVQQYYQLLFSAAALYFYCKNKESVGNSALMSLFLFLNCLVGGGWIFLIFVAFIKIAIERIIRKTDVVFFVTFALCGYFYFILPPDRVTTHAKPLDFLQHPVMSILIAGSLLGSLIDLWRSGIAFATGVGLTFLLIKTLRQRQEVSFPATIGLLSVVFAVLVVVIRAPYELGWAMTTRYTIYSLSMATSVLLVYQTHILSSKKMLRNMLIVCVGFYVNANIGTIKSIWKRKHEIEATEFYYPPGAEIAKGILMESIRLGIYDRKTFEHWNTK